MTNDPANGMDTWVWAQRIADRIRSGAETRVEYLVSNDGVKDVIFHLSVSPTWRQNGSSPSQEHRNHLHTSIKHTASAENDIRPYFVAGGTPAPIQGDDDLDAIQSAKLDDIHAFLMNDVKGKGILTKISDLHAWMSSVKDKFTALFAKTGV